MIFMSWNVRGFNDPLKQKKAIKLDSSKKVTVFGVLETRVKQHDSPKIMKKIGSNWSWVTNYNSSPKGRIWLGWLHNEVKLDVVVQQTDQVIHYHETMH